MSRKITTWILILLAIVLIIWDIYLITNDFKGDSISAVIRDAGERLWIIPWCLMGVCGHFFLHFKTPKWNIRLLIILTLLIGLRDLIHHYWPVLYFPYSPAVVGVVAFFVGGRYWGIRKGSRTN